MSRMTKKGMASSPPNEVVEGVKNSSHGIQNHEPPKRQVGMVRRFFGGALGFNVYAKGLRHMVKPADRDVYGHPVKDNYETLRNIYSFYSAQANASTESLDSLEKISYEQMLELWGVEYDEVELLRRQLRREVFFHGSILFVIVLVGISPLWTGHMHWVYPISTLICLPFMGALVATRFWRLWCLTQRRFVPFKRWVRRHLLPF